MASRQVCSFLVDSQWFGVDVERVQEVLRYQELTKVPLAPAEVRGLINLRGEIVPALDLRRCIGLPALAEDAQPSNVVLRTSDGPLSLLVDEIGEVIAVDEHALEPPPEHLRGDRREVVLAVCRLERELLMILAIDRMIERVGGIVS
jgi:purine-binding chemotaxis protein CheW